MNRRIINLRYKCKSFNFDAAIDIHDILHSHLSPDEKENNISIELYNLDKPDWDVKVIYLEKEDFVETHDDIKGKINEPDSSFSHSFVSFGFIYNETIKWINEILNLNYGLEY